MKIVELFSGIGSQAKALHNLASGEEGIPDLKVETVGTCEWDIHAIIAYDLIHHPEGGIPPEIQAMTKDRLLEELDGHIFSNSGKDALDGASLRTYSRETLMRLLTSIRRNRNSVDINALHGTDMPEDVDLLTYSFPCQDVSNVGALHGYTKGIGRNSGSRSSLLWEVGRILTEMRQADRPLPPFLLMENVPTLLNARNFLNFQSWITDLDRLGYLSWYYTLNTRELGLPQNRERLLMISVNVKDRPEIRDLLLHFSAFRSGDTVVQDYQESPWYHSRQVADLLRTDMSREDLRREALESTPNDTPSRRKIWDNNLKIVDEAGHITGDVIRTVTTKQDRNPNSGNIWYDCGVSGRAPFRYLTARECMLFMGFQDRDYEILRDNSLEFHRGDQLFSRDKIIRLAGNSIPVPLLEAIFLQILAIRVLCRRLQAFMAARRRFLQRRPDLEQETASLLYRRKLIRRKMDIPSRIPVLYYPGHHIALYLEDDSFRRFAPLPSWIPASICRFWEQYLLALQQEAEQDCQEAIRRGLDPVILPAGSLRSPERDAIFDRLASLIKGGGEIPREHGRVMRL